MLLAFMSRPGAVLLAKAAVVNSIQRLNARIKLIDSFFLIRIPPFKSDNDIYTMYKRVMPTVAIRKI